MSEEHGWIRCPSPSRPEGGTEECCPDRLFPGGPLGALLLLPGSHTPQWVTQSLPSAGKESACNAGDPSLIPGSGRSTGEGVGYPLQYSWVPLVAQLEKNLPAMQETRVPYLGWEDPLENGKATHSSILAWRIPGLQTVEHD